MNFLLYIFKCKLISGICVEKFLEKVSGFKLLHEQSTTEFWIFDTDLKTNNSYVWFIFDVPFPFHSNFKFQNAEWELRIFCEILILHIYLLVCCWCYFIVGFTRGANCEKLKTQKFSFKPQEKLEFLMLIKILSTINGILHTTTLNSMFSHSHLSHHNSSVMNSISNMACCWWLNRETIKFSGFFFLFTYNIQQLLNCTNGWKDDIIFYSNYENKFWTQRQVKESMMSFRGLKPENIDDNVPNKFTKHRRQTAKETRGKILKKKRY